MSVRQRFGMMEPTKIVMRPDRLRPKMATDKAQTNMVAPTVMTPIPRSTLVRQMLGTMASTANRDGANDFDQDGRM